MPNLLGFLVSPRAGSQGSPVVHLGDLGGRSQGHFEVDFEVAFGEITLVASSSNSLDHATSMKVLSLLDSLEDLDDVTAVHCNGEFPEGFTG